MARLERLRIYPVKSLDGIDVASARVLDGGTLQYDREFAFYDEQGEVVNGKRKSVVHELETEFDFETSELRVETATGDRHQCNLASNPDRAEAWFKDVFDETVELRRDRNLGYVDRREMGPSLISTATIETVANWFDDSTVEGVRRRLRSNIEVSGVPAFWEDQFVGESAPTLTIGSVRFDGVTPCGRCVVPERDPDTGERNEHFRERFLRKRRETFPAWADPDAFEHWYQVMIITRVHESDRDQSIAVGDPVVVPER